jgi:IS30 family transposase
MAKVQKLRADGVTIREIAKQVGKSPTTITRLVAAWLTRRNDLGCVRTRLNS